MWITEILVLDWVPTENLFYYYFRKTGKPSPEFSKLPSTGRTQKQPDQNNNEKQETVVLRLLLLFYFTYFVYVTYKGLVSLQTRIQKIIE